MFAHCAEKFSDKSHQL